MIQGDMPLGSENSRYQSRFNENAPFRNFNDTPHAPVVTQCEQPHATHSPPNTDLRMDWADACSLGRLPSLKIPAKKWGDTEIAERGCSVPAMRARYRSAGLIPHQRGWTDAG